MVIRFQVSQSKTLKRCYTKILLSVLQVEVSQTRSGLWYAMKFNINRCARVSACITTSSSSSSAAATAYSPAQGSGSDPSSVGAAATAAAALSVSAKDRVASTASVVEASTAGAVVVGAEVSTFAANEVAAAVAVGDDFDVAADEAVRWKEGMEILSCKECEKLTCEWGSMCMLCERECAMNLCVRACVCA